MVTGEFNLRAESENFLKSTRTSVVHYNNPSKYNASLSTILDSSVYDLGILSNNSKI